MSCPYICHDDEFEVLNLNKKFYLNKKIILYIGIVLIVLCVFVYNIMTSGTHFTSKDSEGNEISFNYPDGWSIQERASGVLIQGEKNATDKFIQTFSGDIYQNFNQWNLN